MKKSILLVLLVGLFLISCESGVQNTPVSNSSSRDAREIKMESATPNADGSYTYQIILPTIWEEGLIKDKTTGIQINNGEIMDLPANPDGSNTYKWKFEGPNGDVFVNFGHYNYIGTSDKAEWANAKSIANSRYFIEKDGTKTIGVTFRNGGISPVDPASMVQLRAIININPVEARVGTNMVFSGTGSTAQALPVSTITDYIWDFGDGVTAHGKVVNHSYNSKGDYTVKLIVTDNLGNVNEAIKSVHIFQMAFPPSNMEGGDDYIQAFEDRYAKTITIYVNLSLTHGNHGKPFWWGTVNGVGTAWEFFPILPVPLNEDWGYIVVPFSGREQYEFNYSDYYDYLNGDNRPVGVNWDHMSYGKFYDPLLGHYSMLAANQKISRPY